ncbi:MAG: hypothetical protein RJA70_3720 [Pseudomonadota bacterium]|jgi:hypothetical protein
MSLLSLSQSVFVSFVVAVCAGGSIAVSACSDDEGSDEAAKGEGGSPEETGSVCTQDDQCFAAIDDLQGEPLCLEKVRGGYCTHTCEADTDCCAAEGECKTDLAQVCSPFESAETKQCFLSCEKEDITASGSKAADDNAYCQEQASSDFICRSSGGGNKNRKVCVPGDCSHGATCDKATPCSGDLDCLDEFAGGYCGKRDCKLNADCPGDTLCVLDGDMGFCFKTCGVDSECSFCRAGEVAASCDDGVKFAEKGTQGSVCVPARAR